MQAIEFETYIKKRAIQIPIQYSDLDNIKAKVIILISDDEKKNYDKQNLLLAFSKVKEKNIFKDIKNSVNWQKKIRDEWE